MITHVNNNTFAPESEIVVQELIERLIDSAPSLCLLPKLENIVNKQDPTLEEILELCSHNDTLLSRLTRRSGFQGNEDEFAKTVLFTKGLGFLKSLAIRTMNQEIFDISIDGSGENSKSLKRRSIILARFTKSFCEDLDMEGDLAYLSGLFYQLHHISAELLKYSNRNGISSENNPDLYTVITGDALESLGFHELIHSIVRESQKELYSTSYPFFHALIRIGNGILLNSESSHFRASRGFKPNRELLDATGLKERKIVNTLKEISRNYKGA